MKQLTIISHTEHYRTAEGRIVGLGSTVTEINHLIQIFDRIVHVAMLHNMQPPSSALPYTSDKITFIPLPAVGGQGLSAKLSILTQAPTVLRRINQSLKTSDYFQFRAPTGIGVFVIPYLIFFSRKKGWFKYAGNWKQDDAPIAYALQRWLLKKQSRPVTINGFWNDQPKHCLSFENPCLTQTELLQGKSAIKEKSFQCPIELCFVGRLEAAKGLDVLLDALEQLPHETSKKIAVVHIVGDGDEKSFYKKQTLHSKLRYEFHGFLSRSGVQAIYKRSHAIVLPSKSEGFPKVIAEAMNYGCLPIVSEVSSIGHYITHGSNGLLLPSFTTVALLEQLQRFLELTSEKFSEMTEAPAGFMERFTYDYYNERLLETIL